MATQHSLLLAVVLGFCALEWAGCGRAGNPDACPGSDCAGADSTPPPSCDAGGCAGASSTPPDCGGTGCGGASSDCPGGDCAGAAGAASGGSPSTTDCPGGNCAGAGPDCVGNGCGGAPSGPDCDGGEAGCSGSVCLPNTFRCAGGELLRCRSDGAAEATFQKCASDEYCDARRALCVAQVCEPEVVACDGANVVTCTADGSAEDVIKTCSLTQLCSGGQCRDIVCVPNTRFCTGKDVWHCSADGTSSTLTKHCASSQFCLEQDGSADCSATQCVPGAPLCVGNVATQCAADGSGPEPGGDDCAAAGEACYEGECRDLACTPGRKLCDHDDVYLCTENGTATSLFSDCADGSEFCDPDTAACRTRICTPGTLGCDGTRVATCDALGSSYVASGGDCAAQDKTCVAGSCLPVVCQADAFLCQQGNIYQCNATGTAATLSQQCDPTYYHCILSGSTAYCSWNACTPNSTGCSGNVLSTCKADGSGWASGGTDCTATGKVCQNTACVAQVCTPNAAFCDGNDKRLCQYDGLNSYDYGTCTGNTYCLAQNSSVSCQKTPCNAGATGCLSEKLGTCAADGMSLASVTADCGSQAKLCTPQGCAAQALDTLGTGDQVGTPGGQLYGNEVQVQTARTLTQIEAYLSLPASRALTWVVYEASGDYFSLAFSSATTGTGTGFQSSGPISFTLQAGKTYFIGVNVTGSYVAYYSGPSEQKLLSFGIALGAATASSTSTSVYAYLTPDQVFYFRFTTKP